MDKIRTELVENLLKVIAGLDKADDCYDVLMDLCTVKEIQDMAQRLETARLLALGERYQEIGEKVRVSSATISRVSRCLNYGSGGYQKALKILKGKKSENADKR